MQLWQATWDRSGYLLLWGEKSDHLDSEISPIDDSHETAQLHPFSCKHSQLEAILIEEGFEFYQKSTNSITLPGRDGLPISSLRLPHVNMKSSQNGFEFSRWLIPVIKLDPIDTINFLSTEISEDSKTIKHDHSVVFWREATKLLLELLARGRFLPSIERDGADWLSKWRVLIGEEKDQSRLSTLARSMPPICRCVGHLKNSLENPSLLLESFLETCADQLIRSFMRRHPLIPEEEIEPNSERVATCVSWIRSLSDERKVVDGSEYELTHLEHRLRNWSTRRYSVEGPDNFVTTFRISEPQKAALTGGELDYDGWLLEFLLTSQANTKEQISASKLWNGDFKDSQQGEIFVEKLQENFLRDLSSVLSVFKELRGPLSESHPSSVELSVNEAYRFMNEVVPALKDLGCKAILPDWWDAPSSSLGLSLNIATGGDLEDTGTINKTLGSSELLDFSWEISLGDKLFSLEQFKNFASQSVPLIEIDGKWTKIESRRLSSTIAFLEREKERPKYSFGDAIRLGLGLDYDSEILPVVNMNTTGWLEKLLASEIKNLPEISKPKDFQGDLRPYQLDGLRWLSFLSKLGIGACLADDMGLGKTIQFLALLCSERENDPSENPDLFGKPNLLVVPMSVLANWESEISKFSPVLSYYTHHGTFRAGEEHFISQVAKADIVLTTYSLLQREEKLFSKIHWRRVTLDEAQNIKNIDAKQTKAARRLSRNQVEEFSYCHRLALTGTPLENHLQELWSIMDFLNPGLLSSPTDFRKRFSIPIERNRNDKAKEALSRILKPFILRRVKSDPKVITELPEKIEMESFSSLTEEQASLYKSVLDSMLNDVSRSSGIHRKGLVLSTITKLKQICNHPTLFLKDGRSLANRSGKLSRLEELLDVLLAEGDRILIFTQYAQMGHLLKPHLEETFGSEVLFLHGSLPRKSRDTLIERFQKENGPQIFILSLRAGGHGLNLTKANQVIHYDQWWNPAVREQATDRAHRIGQTQPVQVRRLICRGTLEERIEEMVERKKDLAEQVVGSTKSMITQMSIEELRELLKLAES